MSMTELVLRSIFVFALLFVWTKILGKKLISQMTFFDFVAGVTIGTVGGSIMFTKSVSLLSGTAALSAFCALTLLFGLLALKSVRLRKVLNDEPTLMIKNGAILEEGMAKTRLTMDDLLMLLRKKGAFYLDEVELAFFETDGSLSVLKKSDHLPVTPKDMKLSVPARGQAQTIVLDGKLMENGLRAAGKDAKWVHDRLLGMGVLDVGQVALAQIDQLDQLYVDLRRDGLTH